MSEAASPAARDDAAAAVNPLFAPFRLLFSFRGRASRGAYLLGLLLPAALAGLAIEVFDVEPDFTLTNATVAVLGWWSWFALLVKRLRDIGLEWCWSLLLLIPVLQPLVLLGFAIPRGRPDLQTA